MIPLALVLSSPGPSVSPVISWTFEPTVLVGVAACAVLYGMAWRRARASGSPHAPGFGRLTLFACGLLTLLGALVSPVDELGDQLLVMHMVQHLMLLDVAPILLILGLNKVLLRPITPRVHALERRAGFLASPLFALAFYVGIMWGWHTPPAYDETLRSTTVHAVEHMCFFVAGSLYWWHVISPIRSRHRLTGLGPVAYIVVTRFAVGAIGLVLAFDPSPVYSAYAHGPHYWGLSPIEDQSMAGLVMALEQSIVMGIALSWLFVRMLIESERAADRADRFETAG